MHYEYMHHSCYIPPKGECNVRLTSLHLTYITLKVNVYLIHLTYIFVKRT